MAENLNDAGYDQMAVYAQFKEGFKVPWTMYAIKSIFHVVGNAMFGKDETHKFTTTEIQEIYKVIDQRLSEMTGVHVEWPSIDSMRMESESKEIS